ncbi:MAG TPA: M15 family metallopeptidase [Microthrixaceae bacterium]|nr:M15 family metallopeptidase [Microthrixaceae bacterium]
MSRRHGTSQARNFAAIATTICALLAMVIPASAMSSSSAQGSKSGDGSGTSSRSKAAARQVDVLTATREEVSQKVASLESEYQAQQAAAVAAEAAVVDAKEKVERAKARVALAENEVDLAQETVQKYAVEAYIRPPAQTSMRILSLKNADEATYVRDVLKIMSEERRKVVETLAVKKRIAEMESDLADKTAAEAADKASAARAALASLDDLRQAQADLATSLDERLERALSESAALEAVDKEMAEELAAQELALRNSSPRPVAELVSMKPVGATPNATPNVGQAGTAGSGATPVTNPPKSGPPTTRPNSPTTTRPKAPPTTTKPPTTKPPTTSPPSSGGLVGWDDVVKVGGIWVHKSIAENVRGLLNAATAAGFSLSGGGYRDAAGQIATRRANCGPTYYDIYEKPSGQCTPPTAIPGRSMHEQGKALDLQSNGSLIRSRSNPAFIWLKANAARFGFYNLPSEPWHWSTNGR